jgi:hypothetical protein
LAIRAWLETAIPPVFGKEMDNEFHVANTSNMGTGFFNFPFPPLQGERAGRREFEMVKCSLTLSNGK